MKKTALLYNPVSGPGGRSHRRAAALQRAAEVLRAAGVEALLVETHGPGAAATQAMEMIAAGCDTILACGGDGTVHEAMQHMVEQRSQAALGVIPLGTGNALANDLGVPRDPARAARALLAFQPRRIAVGRMQPAEGGADRYFIVTAGVGGDAHMLYHLNFEIKRRWGMIAYYIKAIAILIRHDFPPFLVDFRDGSQQRSAMVSQLLGVRIRHFPGLIRELAPGASLERDDLRLVMFKTPRPGAFLAYLAARLCGRKWLPAAVELVHADEVICRPVPAEMAITPQWRDTARDGRIYAEADGELTGTLPVRISSVPDALTLLMPKR